MSKTISIAETVAAAKMPQECKDALVRQAQAGDPGALFAVRFLAEKQSRKTSAGTFLRRLGGF